MIKLIFWIYLFFLLSVEWVLLFPIAILTWKWEIYILSNEKWNKIFNEI